MRKLHQRLLEMAGVGLALTGLGGAATQTASGARAMALDERTHDVLLVTARHGHGATYEQIVPNSFVVLVAGT